MREPRLTFDDLIAPRPHLRRDLTARLLKSERVQTKAKHARGSARRAFPGAVTRPKDPLPGAADA
jgi:hypothetical protein